MDPLITCAKAIKNWHEPLGRNIHISNEVYFAALAYVTLLGYRVIGAGRLYKGEKEE
jgi:hypothetical protein